MEQQGYIVGIIDEKTAKLRMERHSACASCGKCATASEKKDIVVEVDNSIGAKVGDRVSVNMESINVLKAAGIAYIFPLISLLMATIGSYYILQLIDNIKNIEIISSIIGIALNIITSSNPSAALALVASLKLPAVCPLNTSIKYIFPSYSISSDLILISSFLKLGNSSIPFR